MYRQRGLRRSSNNSTPEAGFRPNSQTAKQPNSPTRLLVRSAVGGLSCCDLFVVSGSRIHGDPHRAQPLHVPYISVHQRSSAVRFWFFISGRKKPPKLPELTNRQGPPSRYRFSHQRSLESDPLTPRCPTNGISRTHDEPNSAILKTTQYQTDP